MSEIRWRIIIITTWIFLRCSHKSFRIDRVVISPIGNGSYSNTQFKSIRPFCESQTRHISAEAPTKNPNPIGIYIRLIPKPFCSGYLVFNLIFTKIFVGCLFIFCSSKSCSSTIYTYHQITFLSQHIKPQSITIIPRILNRLRAWA